MASKKGTSPLDRPNVSAFVRSLPRDISYADAAERARAVGLELSKPYFFVLKSKLNKQEGQRTRSTAGAARATAPAATGLRLTSDDPHEQAFLDALDVVGAVRGRELLQAFE